MYNIYIIFREYLCNLYIDYSRNTVCNIITDKELLEMYESRARFARAKTTSEL